MVRCIYCRKKLEETFLNKLKGTYMRGKGKLHAVCHVCQKEKSIEELKAFVA